MECRVQFDAGDLNEARIGNPDSEQFGVVEINYRVNHSDGLFLVGAWS